VRIALLTLLSVFLGGCGSLESPKFDNSDWAIDTYNPGQNELVRAEGRAKKFWTENSARYGNDPHYLAIDATKLLEGEIVQDLWPKLINSAHTTAFFAGSLEKYPQVNIYCVMIFDTNTGKFVSNQGYAFVDFPRKGQVVRFGNYVARFIGSGS
jgi:hypothetical protein